MKVTDSALLSQLNESSAKVSDEDLLRKLNTPLGSPSASTGVLKSQVAQPWNQPVTERFPRVKSNVRGGQPMVKSLATNDAPRPKHNLSGVTDAQWADMSPDERYNRNKQYEQERISLGAIEPKPVSFMDEWKGNFGRGGLRTKEMALSLAPTSNLETINKRLTEIAQTGGYTVGLGERSNFIKAYPQDVALLNEQKRILSGELNSNRQDYEQSARGYAKTQDRIMLEQKLGQADGLMDTLNAMDSPATLGLLSESLVSSTPMIAMSALTRNPAYLAMIGTLGAGAQEYSIGVMDYFQQNNIDPETATPEQMQDAFDYTNTRTGIVGAAGGLGSLVAGTRLIPKNSMSPAKTVLAEGGAQALVNTGIEGGGEALAGAATGNFNWGDTLLEAGGGAVTAPIEATQVLREAHGQSGKDFTATSTPEQLAEVARNPKTNKETALAAMMELMQRGMSLDEQGNLVKGVPEPVNAPKAPVTPLGVVGQQIEGQAGAVPVTPVVPPQEPEKAPVEPQAPTAPVDLGGIIDGIFGTPKGQEETVPQGGEVVSPLSEPTTPPAVQPLGGERRTDQTERKRIDDLTIEEARKELRTDPLTGGQNRRAYDETPKRAVQVSTDMDGLKAVNDNFGHSAGDTLIKAYHQTLIDNGLEVYRLGGDEFALQFDTDEDADAKMQKAQADFGRIVFTFQTPDGKIVTKTGLGASYGKGKTFDEADANLLKDKQRRKELGLRGERGELNGGAQGLAEGNEAPVSEAPDWKDDSLNKDGIKKDPAWTKTSPTAKKLSQHLMFMAGHNRLRSERGGKLSSSSVDVAEVRNEELPIALRNTKLFIDDIFKTPVVFYKKLGKSAKYGFEFSGFTTRLDNVTYVDVDNGHAILGVVMHEFTHQMARQEKALYQRLADYVEKNGDYNLHARQRRYEHLNKAGRIEEVVADLVGDAMSDPEFLKTLSKKDPSLFGELAQKLIDYIDNFLKKVAGYRDFNSSQYIKDVAEFREMLAEVMVEYGKVQKQKPTIVVSKNKPKAKGSDYLYSVADKKNSKPIASMNDFTYSALKRLVEGSSLKNVSGDQWQKWISANGQKSGVKADEIEATGIYEWLSSQEGKVSKDDVIAYLDANGVQVTEVQKGNYDGVPKDDSQILKHDDPNYRVAGGKNYREVVLTLPDKKGFTPETETRYQLWEDGELIAQGDSTSAERWRNNEPDRPLDIRVVQRETQSSRMSNTDVFRSSHWDEPNVLAHIRLGEHTDADGNKVLFVYEIQSDWGQAGRKNGWRNDAERKDKTAKWKAIYDEIEEKFKAFVEKQADAMYAAIPNSNLERETVIKAINDATNIESRARHVGMMDRYYEAKTLREDESQNEYKQPNAPFVTDTKAWVGLAIKRVTAMAVEEGFDKVVFASGQQAADYFDLSKKIDRIQWKDYSTGIGSPKSKEITIVPLNEDYFSIYPDENGKIKGGKTAYIGKQLEDIVGKEIAIKIMESEKGTLADDGLKVGGEGMKGFYDKLVPQVANDVLKKLGGVKVEPTKVKTSDGLNKQPVISSDGNNYWLSESQFGNRISKNFDTAGEAMDERDNLAKGIGKQLGFTITDEMKAKIDDGDVPLFSNNPNTKLDDAKSFVTWIEGVRSKGFDSLTSRADSLQKAVPQLKPVFKKIFIFAGSKGVGAKTIIESAEQIRTTFHNEVEKTIEGAFGHNKDLSEQENDELRQAVLGFPVPTPAIQQAGQRISELMKQARDRAEAAGIPIGEVTDIGYLPRVYKTHEIQKNKDGFLRDATRLFHDHEFELEVGDASQTYTNKKMLSKYIALMRLYGLTDPTVKAAVRVVKDQMRIIKGTKDQATRIAAFQEIINQMNAVRPIVQQKYAEMRANAWFIGMGMRTMRDYVNVVPDPKARPTKNRVLSGAADTVMKDWLDVDIRELMSGYAGVMSRKIAASEAFGKDPMKATDNILNGIRRRGEMTERQFDEAQALISSAMGWKDKPWSKDVASIADGMATLATLGLLEQATFTSLAEPITTTIRSGNIKHLALPLRQLATAVTRSRVKDRDVAYAIGLIARNAASAVSLHRVGVMEADYSKWSSKVLTRFFTLNMLTQLTNDQRLLAMRVGAEEFKRLAKKALRGNAMAIDFMNEHGISDIQAFSDWIESINGIPQASDIYGADGAMTPMGQIYADAVHRFVNGSIQNPNATLKPAWASDPKLRLVSGIMSFAYAIYENLIKREMRILAGGTKAQAVNRFSTVFAPTMVALVVSQIAISALRMVINGDDPDDEEFWDKATKRGTLNVVSFGISGQMLNFVTGYKYASTASETIIGAYPAYFSKALDMVMKSFSDRNSDNTETAEFAKGKGIYDLFGSLVVAGASSLPDGWKWLARGVIAIESSKQSKEKFAEMFGVPPERENATDKQYSKATKGSEEATALVTDKLGDSDKAQWDAQFEAMKKEFPELLEGYEFVRYADNSENRKKGRAGDQQTTPSGKVKLKNGNLDKIEDEKDLITSLNKSLKSIRSNSDMTYADLSNVIKIGDKSYSPVADEILADIDEDEMEDEIGRATRVKVIKDLEASRTEVKKKAIQDLK